MSLETAQKVIVPQKKNYVPQKKNYVPHFLKQRDINSYIVKWIKKMRQKSFKDKYQQRSFFSLFRFFNWFWKKSSKRYSKKNLEEKNVKRNKICMQIWIQLF
jgi:hypothetical protein